MGSRAREAPGDDSPPRSHDDATDTTPTGPRRGHDRTIRRPGARALGRGAGTAGRARSRHAALGLPARHGRAVPDAPRADAGARAGVPAPPPQAHLAGLGWHRRYALP